MNTTPKPILGVKDGQIMLRFRSMKEASRVLANRESKMARSRVHRKLRDALEGKRELYWGFTWKYDN